MRWGKEEGRKHSESKILKLVTGVRELRSSISTLGSSKVPEDSNGNNKYGPWSTLMQTIFTFNSFVPVQG